MVQNVPRGGPFRDVFGAHLLPRVLAEMIAGLHPGFSLRLLTLAAFAALVSVMGVWLFYLTRWREFRNAVTCLPESEKIFLVRRGARRGLFLRGIEHRILVAKRLANRMSHHNITARLECERCSARSCDQAPQATLAGEVFRRSRHCPLLNPD